MSQENEELYHYGVKGMKWGVRKASRRLSSASTEEERDSAISDLKKHRAKASKKLKKLNSKASALDDKMATRITKNTPKAAKYKAKALRYQRKSTKRLFTDDYLRERNAEKAAKYKNKAESIEADTAVLQAKIEKNKRLMTIYNQSINDIDTALVESGKRFVKGR